MNEMTACNLIEAAYSQVTAAFWIFLVTQKDFRKKQKLISISQVSILLCVCVADGWRGSFLSPAGSQNKYHHLGEMCSGPLHTEAVFAF